VLVGGNEKRAIVLVDHDPAWGERFRRERERIVGALGSVALAVEHIGSTAVPCLVAKPIIDVLVTVADVEDEECYLPGLVAAGYVLRVREPGHRLVRTPLLDVHAHVLAEGSAAARDHLLFRDRLRADAADRARYAEVKRELARREWPSMNSYAEAKGEVIRDILRRASAPTSGNVDDRPRRASSNDQR